MLFIIINMAYRCTETINYVLRLDAGRTNALNRMIIFLDADFNLTKVV